MIFEKDGKLYVSKDLADDIHMAETTTDRFMRKMFEQNIAEGNIIVFDDRIAEGNIAAEVC